MRRVIKCLVYAVIAHFLFSELMYWWHEAYERGLF